MEVLQFTWLPLLFVIYLLVKVEGVKLIGNHLVQKNHLVLIVIDIYIMVRSLQEVVSVVHYAWLMYKDKPVISQLPKNSCNPLTELLQVSVVLEVGMVSVDGELVR